MGQRCRLILGGFFLVLRVLTALASERARKESATSVSRIQLPMRRNIDGFGGLGWAPLIVMFWATLVRFTRWPTVGVTGRESRGP